MKFTSTLLAGVVIIEPQVFKDERGFFMETWQARKFAEAGIHANFVQDNHSKSIKGTLRGLHFQIKQPQGKLVRAIAGEIFDVIIDIRKGSPTYGKWIGVILSEENKRQIWIPPGFAHGFLVLSQTAEFVYKCTDFYAPQYERAIRWDDPDIAVQWPLKKGEAPILSEKDSQAPFLRDAENNFVYGEV